jgi:transposase
MRSAHGGHPFTIHSPRRGERRRPDCDYASMEREGAVFYMLATGCQWKALPKDLPPKSTARSKFMLWDWSGTLERIYDSLYVAVRESAGKEASRRRRLSNARAPRSLKKESID